MPKVLIVDDSPTVLTSLTRLLEEGGCEVITARDGLTTLSNVIANTPDLILLDIGLPGVSGLDLCVAIKHMPDFASIPIIVITGSQRQFDQTMAYRLGVAAYIQKPVNPALLLRLVGQLTQPHRAAEMNSLTLGSAAAD